MSTRRSGARSAQSLSNGQHSEMLLPCAERKELDAVREPWTYSMSAAAEDPERRRLRQQAELAGSLAPRGMATYAGERGLWRRCTRAERQRIVWSSGGARGDGAVGAAHLRRHQRLRRRGAWRQCLRLAAVDDGACRRRTATEPSQSGVRARVYSISRIFGQSPPFAAAFRLPFRLRSRCKSASSDE